MSLCEWDIIGTPRFIGLRNYATTLSDMTFRHALLVTFLFVGVTVPVNVTLALLTAILLNGRLALRNLFRSIIFFPAFTSMVAIGMLWKYMYSTDYGIINYIITLFGGHPKDWLANPAWAPWSLMLTSVWYGFGWNMVIFLAGLQNIPDQYYEAAAIDGASKWAAFRFITLPLLKPISLFVVVMAVIYAFRMFDLVYVMTMGGPGTSTMVLMMYFYRQAFIMLRMGQGSAVALILFVVVFFFTVLQLRFFKGEVSY